MPPVPARVTSRQLAAAQPTMRPQEQAGALTRAWRGILAAFQPAGDVQRITTSQQLAEALRFGTRTDAGVDVTPSSSMHVAAVYRCVNIIAGTMAMMPWRVYERTGDKEALRPEHPVDLLLNRDPNRWQSPFQLKQWIALCQCLRGNCYYVKHMKGGKLVELVPTHPDRMTVEQIGDFDVRYIYTGWDGVRTVFTPNEVLHFRTISLDGLRGLSPISAAMQGIGLAMAAEKFGARHFGNGVRPSVAVNAPEGLNLSDEQITRLRSQIEDVLGGVSNSHKVAVLEAGMKFQTLSMTADEAQYVDGRKFQRSEIAMFFGVPPHMLGDVDKQTSWGTGIEQQGKAFEIYTMLPWLTAAQDTADGRVFGYGESQFFTRFDTKALKPSDLSTLASSINSLINSGIISPNEGRQMLGMNPRDDDAGDDFIVPGQTRIDSKGGSAAGGSNG